MTVVLKEFISEFGIGISEHSNFESKQLQSILAKFSDWGSTFSPQAEAWKSLVFNKVKLYWYGYNT